MIVSDGQTVLVLVSGTSSGGQRVSQDLLRYIAKSFGQNSGDSQVFF